jgi:hypothetical protein
VSVVASLAYCDIRDPVTTPGLEVAQRPTKLGWAPYPAEGWHGDDRSASFSVAELAILGDGRRVLLHDERGFTLGIRPSGDPLSVLTAPVLERQVLATVLPDDDDAEEEHPYDWLARLCAKRGVGVTADELRRVPYMVEFSSRVLEALAASHDDT